MWILDTEEWVGRAMTHCLGTPAKPYLVGEIQITGQMKDRNRDLLREDAAWCIYSHDLPTNCFQYSAVYATDSTRLGDVVNSLKIEITVCQPLMRDR